MLLFDDPKPTWMGGVGEVDTLEFDVYLVRKIQGVSFERGVDLTPSTTIEFVLFQRSKSIIYVFNYYGVRNII